MQVLTITEETKQWSPEEEALIVSIMCTETMHDPNCQGCTSCDDFSTRESCHRLCDRPRAIQRMRRRTSQGTQSYAVCDTDRRIYARELKRWSKTFLSNRKRSIASEATPESARQSRVFEDPFASAAI